MENILSIVIPYFNAKNTIERAFVSIDKMQRDPLFSFDVIVVDDGSTEDFPKHLLNRYNFTCSIYKVKNNGPLLARCFGIEKAKSKYIYFLDADDELRETFFVDFCEQYRKEDVDIFLVDFYRCGSVVCPHREKPALIDDKYYIRHLAGTADLGYAVTQIFKKDIFTPNIKEEFMKNKIRFSEDLLFWIRIYKKNRKYSSLEYPSYIYNINNNSVSASLNYSKICDIVYVLNARYYFVLEHEENYNIRAFYKDVVAQICFLRKAIGFYVKKKEKRRCLSIFQKIIFIDEMINCGKYSLSIKNKFFFFIIKMERRHFKTSNSKY